MKRETLRLSRKVRAQALRQARRLCRSRPYLVVAKHRDEIIVADWHKVFDGWEKYGSHSYPRSHTVCYVMRAGVTGKNWRQDYKSIRSLRAAYPRIDSAFRADEAAERRLAAIINGRDEAIVYKTLHVAEDGSLQSPYDGSRWEIGVPREAEMRPIKNMDYQCVSGGLFATGDPEEWHDYPKRAAARTERLIVVQCIARDVERLEGKLRARILCPIGIVISVQKNEWGNYDQIHVAM